VNGKLNGIPISVTARVFYFNDETWKKRASNTRKPGMS
jgi:oligogalacturonide transport system substrate-binding protein